MLGKPSYGKSKIVFFVVIYVDTYAYIYIPMFYNISISTSGDIVGYNMDII